MNILEVLHILESSEMLRTSRQVGNYMQIYCPFHSDGNEHKPSCGVLLSDEYRNGQHYPAGFTHCFACQYANPIDVMIGDLLKIRHIDKSGLEWLVDNIPGFVPDTDDFDPLLSDALIESVSSRYAVQYISNLVNGTQEYVSEQELAKYRFTVPYMYERKLTDEIISRFDVGFDPDWIAPGKTKKTPCITFPVRDANGRTLFLCRRSIVGKFFNYPKGISKPVYGVYELPCNTKSVVICESCFNALTSWVYGRPAVALLGTGNPYQIQQLKELGVNEFILAFDPDEAGRRATEKMKRLLKKTAIVWSFSGIPDGKDINDLTKDEFDALILE